MICPFWPGRWHRPLAMIAWLAITESSFQTAERAIRALLAGVTILVVMVVGWAIAFAAARALRRRRVGIARAVIVGWVPGM